MGFRISREAAEKTTDKARGMFEKYTGRKVSFELFAFRNFPQYLLARGHFC